MKKILIMFLVAIIFIYPIHNAMYPQHADAAIASKAASQAAKQIAKEVIQEAAVNQAANFAVMQAMDIANKYQSKPGFKVVCPDGSSVCDKPIQVKENITESDKQAIKAQAGTELDKLLNGGTGVSKWQKFLDWFMPVWLISFGATALTYALDSDVRSLFNEAGYNALVALGLITPLSDTNVRLPIEEVPIKEPGTTLENDVVENENMKSVLKSWYSSDAPHEITGLNMPNHDFMIHTILTPLNNQMYSLNIINPTIVTLNGSEFVRIQSNRLLFNPEWVANNANNIVTISVNGEIVKTVPVSVYNYRFEINTVNETGLTHSTEYGKLKSIMTRAPYKVGDFWYTDILWDTVDGNIFKYQLRTTENNMPSTINSTKFNTYFTSATQKTIGTTVYKNESGYKQVLPPLFDDLSTSVDPMSASSYKDGDDNLALIPPSALTFKEESTGETVYRVPAAVPTDPPVFQKEDGTIVPEENITVGPDPVITPSPGGQTTPGGEPIPEGTPTVTPSPSPSNPSPQPIPLTPTPTPTPQPDPNTPPPTSPPIETTPPAFPEGESCDEGLKIPKFLPLLTKISETFPFSIPFDLYGGFEAIFAEMGKERPEFDFKFNALGEDVSWKITIPDFIDDWKPFTDSFLIFIFDVGIVYAIFRFTGGGK